MFLLNSLQQSESTVKSGSVLFQSHYISPTNVAYVLVIGRESNIRAKHHYGCFSKCMMSPFNVVQILVIGREGSLRTQRRHGCVYMLSGNVDRGHFKYSEYSQSVSSRSGHTTTFVGSKLYIIGGRSDNLLEVGLGHSVSILLETCTGEKL